MSRLRLWAGASAVATALLFTGANVIWALEQPDPGASGRELVAFYNELAGRIEVGAPLSLLSLAALLVFVSALRGLLVALDEDELCANLAFAGALVGLAAGVGAETINLAAALRAGDGELTEPVAVVLFDVSYLLGTDAAGIGLGLLTLALGWAALRTGALLPRGLAVVAVAVGAASLTPFWHDALGQYGLGPGFVLLLVLGVLLLRPTGPEPSARGTTTARASRPG